jgi:hypothetical protein
MGVMDWIDLAQDRDRGQAVVNVVMNLLKRDSASWSKEVSKNMYIYIYIIYLLWLYSLTRAMASSFTRFLDHTQRRATVGRTPLDE